MSTLRRSLRNHEKTIYDEKKDNIEYLKDSINLLNSLKNGYFKQNQYQAKNIKYHGIETIKHFFDVFDEDYDLYPIKDQQYQSFSGKILLPRDEYLEKNRPELIKIIRNWEINLLVTFFFKSTKNFNDKRTRRAENKNLPNIDEILDELIKKYYDSTKSLKILTLYQKELSQ